MKAENFKDGVRVRIKPNAPKINVPETMVGAVGTLSMVKTYPDGHTSGWVKGYLVQPKHVSRVKPIETEMRRALYAFGPEPADAGDAELTPGLYTDRDGDLWAVASTPQDSTLRVACIMVASDIASSGIVHSEIGGGVPVSDFADSISGKQWGPLYRIADLPKGWDDYKGK